MRKKHLRLFHLPIELAIPKIGQCGVIPQSPIESKCGGLQASGQEQ